MSRLWDKGESLDDRVLRFTAAEDHVLDQRLVHYDVIASSAHADMLHQQGLLSAGDHQAIATALAELDAEYVEGNWQITLADEDCHTALERVLTERIGAAGGRIHLGRSRNDQVLAALRLYLRDAVDGLRSALSTVIEELRGLEHRQGKIALPGYTHMQQAMPSSVALWAGGFVTELADDNDGLTALNRRLGKNPLGSAAGYGTPGVPIDRDATTQALGFLETQKPVTAVQLSRGKAESQILFEISLMLNDLGRLAADLLLFYTQEFAYVHLPASLTTGSSIMPQKRNPDVLELLRAAPATAIGALQECLGITQKLTSGYHRDLQRLKAPLFRGIDLGGDCLHIVAAMLAGLEFREDRIQLHDGLYAAEQANRLVVEEGLAFRDAYKRVAQTFKDPQ